MSVVNGYATVEQAADFVGQVAPDDRLADIVTAASRLIDDHTGRRFFQVAEVRRFDTEFCHDLHLGPFNDLASITSLKADEDDDGTFERTYSAGEYQLLPFATSADPRPYERIRLVRPAEFPTWHPHRRQGRIEVTGTWGWSSAPVQVREACLLIVNEMVSLARAPFGVTGVGDLGIARVAKQLPPRAVDLLDTVTHDDHRPGFA